MAIPGQQRETVPDLPTRPSTRALFQKSGTVWFTCPCVLFHKSALSPPPVEAMSTFTTVQGVVPACCRNLVQPDVPRSLSGMRLFVNPRQVPGGLAGIQVIVPGVSRHRAWRHTTVQRAMLRGTRAFTVPVNNVPCWYLRCAARLRRRQVVNGTCSARICPERTITITCSCWQPARRCPER